MICIVMDIGKLILEDVDYTLDVGINLVFSYVYI